MKKIFASAMIRAAMDAARDTVIMRSDGPLCFTFSPPIGFAHSKTAFVMYPLYRM